jgi:hypothetical protein
MAPDVPRTVTPGELALVGGDHELETLAKV